MKCIHCNNEGRLHYGQYYCHLHIPEWIKERQLLRSCRPVKEQQEAGVIVGLCIMGAIIILLIVVIFGGV